MRGSRWWEAARRCAGQECEANEASQFSPLRSSIMLVLGEAGGGAGGEWEIKIWGTGVWGTFPS